MEGGEYMWLLEKPWDTCQTSGPMFTAQELSAVIPKMGIQQFTHRGTVLKEMPCELTTMFAVCVPINEVDMKNLIYLLGQHPY
jgi:hypothetical protein